jgi:hypothetical protein
MALASLLAVPARVNLALTLIASAAQLNGIEVDFAPTLASGAKFNLSGATSYAVAMDNGQDFASGAYFEASPPNTLLTAGAAGGSLTILAAELESAYNALQATFAANSGRISITASDDTNTVLVATGTWSMTRTA